MVRLAAVNDDVIGPTVTIKSLPEEALCRCKITMFAEKELDRVTNAVDRPIQIHPAATDFNVSLVYVPFLGHCPLSQVEAF
jgi:hypothetical protein